MNFIEIFGLVVLLILFIGILYIIIKSTTGLKNIPKRIVIQPDPVKKSNLSSIR